MKHPLFLCFFYKYSVFFKRLINKYATDRNNMEVKKILWLKPKDFHKVPGTRIELARLVKSRGILSPLCLPIPPSRRRKTIYIIFKFYSTVKSFFSVPDCINLTFHHATENVFPFPQSR